VSVELEDFPHGPSTITFHVKVNGTQSTKTDQFAGPVGRASANVSGLTTATGTLNIEAYASWTIEGGGKSETAHLETVCRKPPHKAPGERPPVLVGGVTAERPSAPAGSAVTADQAPAAASDVTTDQAPTAAGSAVTAGQAPTAPASAVSAGPTFTG
jgi:hypothetical protein